VLSILIITGCTSNQSNNVKKSLINVEKQSSITISEPLIWFKKSTSWATVDVTQGLLPGVYTSTQENSSGTFYYGASRSYFFHDVNTGKYYLRIGGFWVPKSNTATPRLFYIVDSQYSIVTATSLEAAIKQNTATESASPNGPNFPTQPTNMAQGAGYGLGMGIVNAIAESETGNAILISSESDNGFSEHLASIIEKSR
jgi:hypothetical protein